MQDTSKTASQKAKLSAAEIEMALVRWLHSGEVLTSHIESFRKFPVKFHVVRELAGSGSRLFAIEGGVATQVIKSRAAGILFNYLIGLPKKARDYKLTQKKCCDIIESLMACEEHSDTPPKLVGFKSDPEPVQHRLAFDPVDTTLNQLEVAAPYFYSLLSRMGNREAFMARLGSLYDPTADRKQVVWIYGPPDCGKSRLEVLMKKMVGRYLPLNSYALKNPDKYIPVIIGRRLAVVQEAPPDFIRSDEFKALTGDDYHYCNPKYQQPYDAKINTMFFFMSNNAPEIPSDEALKIRLIACKMTAVAATEMIPSHELDRKMEEELPAIVGCALRIYEGYRQTGRIYHDMGVLEEAIDDFESEYDDILNTYFVFDENASILANTFRTTLEENNVRNPKLQHAVITTLRNRYGIKKTRVTNENYSDGSPRRVWKYEGIRVRDDLEKPHVKKEKSENGSVTDLRNYRDLRPN